MGSGDGRIVFGEGALEELTSGGRYEGRSGGVDG